MSGAEEIITAKKNIQMELFLRIRRHQNIATDTVLLRHNDVISLRLGNPGHHSQRSNDRPAILFYSKSSSFSSCTRSCLDNSFP